MDARWAAVAGGAELKEVCPVEKGEGPSQMGLKFQVAEVRKPLLAVCKMVEKGNAVTLGPGKDGCFISNPKTGNKFILRPNGKGSYLMDVGERTQITVYSGAEENVCPKDWGVQFSIMRQGRK